MNHRYIEPNLSLRNLVITVLVFDGNAGTGSELPAFTSGMPVLFCRTTSNPKGAGPIQLSLFASTPADVWKVDSNSTIIAYFFKPYSLACLFNVDARKLSDKALDLRCWNPQRYSALEAQLTEASGTTKKIEVLDKLINRQFGENELICRTVEFATDQMMRDSTTEAIPKILESLKLNERTFQRIFKKYVGVTATRYRRICQFEGAFSQLHRNQFDSITDVAIENGFADHSHFVRSFKEFTEQTPSEYLKNGLKNKM